MNDNAGRGPGHGRRRRPGGPPPDRPQPGGGAPPPDAPPELPGVDSLERLRDRIARVVDELQRLREENVALSARIRELEGGAALRLGPAAEKDPEALRRKIGGFIEAIDRYLEQDNQQA